MAVEDDFFVFEPQLTLGTKLTEHYRLSSGAGYRLTAATGVLGDRVRGVSGSVALQIAC